MNELKYIQDHTASIDDSIPDVFLPKRILEKVRRKILGKKRKSDCYQMLVNYQPPKDPLIQIVGTIDHGFTPNPDLEDTHIPQPPRTKSPSFLKEHFASVSYIYIYILETGI